jgi:hypothetical protein
MFALLNFVEYTEFVLRTNPLQKVYYISKLIIALLHLSLFVSDWRRQVGGLLVKTYRHGISEIFLKVVLNTKIKHQPNHSSLIILRFVSVTSQGLDFQCRMLWVFCVQ